MQKNIERNIWVLLFLSGVVLYTKLPSILDLCYWNTVVFLRSGADYPKIRASNAGIDAEEVKGLVPSDAMIFFKFNAETQEPFRSDTTVSKVPDDIRYQFYPLSVNRYDSTHINKTGKSYIVDYNSNSPPECAFITLKKGQHLLDMNHSGFLKKTPENRAKESFILLSFLIISATYILIGCLFLGLFKFNAKGLIHLLTSGYLAGLLLVNISLGAELALGLVFTRLLVIATGLTLFLILFGIAGFKPDKIFVFSRQSSLEKNEYARFCNLITVFIVIIAGLVLWLNIIRPVDNYGDAITFWMLKAKMLFHEQAFVFKDVFHKEYPILLPLTVATNYVGLNSIADELAMWGVNVIYICLLSQIYAGVLEITKAKPVALVSVLLYALCYFSSNITLIPTGDQLLMAFLTLSAMNAILFVANGGNNHLALSFFFAMGMALTKQEGCIYASLIGFSILFFTFSGVKNLKPVLVFVSFSLLGLLNLCWVNYMAGKGYKVSGDFVSEPISISKIYTLFKAQIFIANSADLQKGIIAGMIFAFAVISKKLQSAEVRFLVFFIFLSWLFTFFALLPWKQSTIANYAFTATPRLAVQSSPLLVILLGILSCDYLLDGISTKNKTIL